MDERQLYHILLYGWAALAPATLAALFFVTAPYGRHLNDRWGPTIDSRAGWVIMEAPASLLFLLLFFMGRHGSGAPELLFFIAWEVHYIHRAFIYPLGMRGVDKKIPASVVAMAFVFNTGNGYLNGRYIFEFSGGYPLGWIWSPRFVMGAALFIAGFIVNRAADRTLRGLRGPGESGYAVPMGGLYRWISCPNYLGEMIQWIGWAVATWSPAGCVFALWTVANLLPRTRAHHAWYRAHFREYPSKRKALIPGLW